MSETIGYRAGELECEAYVARPAGPGPHPAVLIAPTVRGPTADEVGHAEHLASQGYVAAVFDPYGKAERNLETERARALMMELLGDRALLRDRLMAALGFVQGLDGVDRSRTAVMGFCFGGLCALDLARTGTDRIRGAVSIHGIFAKPELGPQPPIEAKVLVLHGWDDPMAMPEQVLSLTQELTEAGADWQLHAFGHTVHGFTNPAANMPERGVVYSEAADRRSRDLLDLFLREVLG